MGSNDTRARTRTRKRTELVAAAFDESAFPATQGRPRSNQQHTGERRMLIEVKNDNGDNWLIKVTTTNDPAQARLAAYCYCYGDEEPPQPATVNDYTRVATVTTI